MTKINVRTLQNKIKSYVSQTKQHLYTNEGKFKINEEVFMSDYKDINNINWSEATIKRQIGSKVFECIL